MQTLRKTTTQSLLEGMHKRRIAEETRTVEKRRLANDVRDLRNWLAVYEREYDLPANVVNDIDAKLHRMAERLTKI